MADSTDIIKSQGDTLALATPGYTIKTKHVPQMFKQILQKNPGVMNYMQNAKNAIDNFVSSNETAINKGVKSSGITLDGYVINSALDGFDKRKLVILIGSLKSVKDTKVVNGIQSVECPVSYYPRVSDDAIVNSMAYLTYLIKNKQQDQIPPAFAQNKIDPEKVPQTYLTLDQQKKLCPGVGMSGKVTPEEKVKVINNLKEYVEGVLKAGGRKVFDTIKEIQKRGEEINNTVLLTNLSCIKVGVPKTLMVRSGEFVRIGGLKMTHTYMLDGEKFPCYNTFGASTVTPTTQIPLEDFFRACVEGGSYMRHLQHEPIAKPIASKDAGTNPKDKEEKNFKIESVEGSKMLYVRPFDQEYLYYLMTQPNQLFLYYTKPRVDDESNNLTIVYAKDATAAKVTNAKPVAHKKNDTVISGFQWKKPVLKVVGDRIVKNEDCEPNNLEVISVRVDMWESDLQFTCIEDTEAWKKLGQMIVEKFEGLLLVTPNYAKSAERQSSMEKVLLSPAMTAKQAQDNVQQEDYSALLDAENDDDQSQMQTSTDALAQSSQETFGALDLQIPTVATNTFYFDMMSVITDMRVVYSDLGIPISLDGIFNVIPTPGLKVDIIPGDKNSKEHKERSKKAFEKARREYRFNSQLHARNFHNRADPSVICVNEYQGTLGELESKYSFVVVSNSEIFAGKENIPQVSEQHSHYLFTADYANASTSDDSLKKFWDNKRVPADAIVRTIRMRPGDVRYVFALRKPEKSNIESSIKTMKEKLFDFQFDASPVEEQSNNNNNAHITDSGNHASDSNLKVSEVDSDTHAHSDPAADTTGPTVSLPDEGEDLLGEMQIEEEYGDGEETMKTTTTIKSKSKRTIDDVNNASTQKNAKKKK